MLLNVTLITGILKITQESWNMHSIHSLQLMTIQRKVNKDFFYIGLRGTCIQEQW